MGVPLTDGETVRIFTGNDFVDWDVSQPHNGYIETFFQLGAIGLVALAIGLFWTFKQCQRRLPTELGIFFLLLNFSYSLMIAQGTLIRTIWYAVALSAMTTAGTERSQVARGGPSDEVSNVGRSRKTVRARFESVPATTRKSSRPAIKELP